MILKSIEMSNFRNYEREEFHFHEGTNVLTVIMHREKRMCWKPFTLGARQSRTREAKIRT